MERRLHNLLRQETQRRIEDRRHGNLPRLSDQVGRPASFNVRGSLPVDLLEHLMCLPDRARVALDPGPEIRVGVVSSFESQLHVCPGHWP